jgi:hypothetical protein
MPPEKGSTENDLPAKGSPEEQDLLRDLGYDPNRQLNTELTNTPVDLSCLRSGDLVANSDLARIMNDVRNCPAAQIENVGLKNQKTVDANTRVFDQNRVTGIPKHAKKAIQKEAAVSVGQALPQNQRFRGKMEKRSLTRVEKLQSRVLLPAVKRFLATDEALAQFEKKGFVAIPLEEMRFLNGRELFTLGCDDERNCWFEDVVMKELAPQILNYFNSVIAPQWKKKGRSAIFDVKGLLEEGMEVFYNGGNEDVLGATVEQIGHCIVIDVI